MKIHLTSENDPENDKEKIVLGIFHETPGGRIADTYGYNGHFILYYFDDGQGGRKVSKEEFRSWKPREDLRDFPNARDPRLPYEFDLWWDMKTRSELIHALKYRHQDHKDIKRVMKAHSIVLTADERKRIKSKDDDDI